MTAPPEKNSLIPIPRRPQPGDVIQQSLKVIITSPSPSPESHLPFTFSPSPSRRPPKPPPKIKLHQQPIHPAHSSRDIPSRKHTTTTTTTLITLSIIPYPFFRLPVRTINQLPTPLQPPQLGHNTLDSPLDVLLDLPQFLRYIALLSLKVDERVHHARIGFEVRGRPDLVDAADEGGEPVDLHEELVQRVGEGGLG